MPPIEPLNLYARQWQFLSDPHAYVEESVRPLVLESTRRQFVTAADILSRLNGSFEDRPRRGLLLADDVGLGKTPVAALVAWVVASSGEGRSVRILAPNDVMMRRWEEELLGHVEPMRKCAPHLDVRASRVKARQVDRLAAGSIQVVKHSYASSDLNLTCDLLIVDEAHRAKGDQTYFSRALRRQRRYAKRILILTATPFSIHIDELLRMLDLIGANEASTPVRAYSRALRDLYTGNTSRSSDVVAERLAAKAKAAVEAMAPFVIRHGVDDLPAEQNSFGTREDWLIPVPEAKPSEEELLLRMDRALRIASQGGVIDDRTRNDPRFHVGWRYYDTRKRELRSKTPLLTEPARAVVQSHLAAMGRLRKEVGLHSKIVAVGEAVREIIEQGEKVLLFCHHHATAQELAVCLHKMLPAIGTQRTPALKIWEAAWNEVLGPMPDDPGEQERRRTFVRWLCGDLVRYQTWSWLGARPTSAPSLAAAIQARRSRGYENAESIGEATRRLYGALEQSRSSRAVLMEAADRPDLLPGANGASRVLAVCEPGEDDAEADLFVHNRQPDTVISVFNSPFGPDVLVVTDRLSEGIDLHRYCRYLAHYELDPSPVRTVQRNGRVRRVNSWAAVTGKSIRYAYPAFRGTRDHRVVQIMKKRIDSFSLLLGGVQDFDVDQIVGSDERWRNDVIQIAKRRLSNSIRGLRAREFAEYAEIFTTG
jgi:ERCC4-related helicase